MTIGAEHELHNVLAVPPSVERILRFLEDVERILNAQLPLVGRQQSMTILSADRLTAGSMLIGLRLPGSGESALQEMLNGYGIGRYEITEFLGWLHGSRRMLQQKYTRPLLIFRSLELPPEAEAALPSRRREASVLSDQFDRTSVGSRQPAVDSAGVARPAVSATAPALQSEGSVSSSYEAVPIRTTVRQQEGTAHVHSSPTRVIEYAGKAPTPSGPQRAVAAGKEAVIPHQDIRQVMRSGTVQPEADLSPSVPAGPQRHLAFANRIAWTGAFAGGGVLAGGLLGMQRPGQGMAINDGAPMPTMAWSQPFAPSAPGPSPWNAPFQSNSRLTDDTPHAAIGTGTGQAQTGMPTSIPLSFLPVNVAASIFSARLHGEEGNAQPAVRPLAPGSLLENPSLGQLTLIAPSLKVATEDIERRGGAVAFDWAALRKGHNTLDERGLLALRKALPADTQLIYPALPPNRLPAGGVNLRLAQPMVAGLLTAGYGVPAYSGLAGQAVGSAVAATGGTPVAATLPGTLVLAKRPVGQTAIFAPTLDNLQVLHRDDGKQSTRGGTFDFLGLPITFAPVVGGRSDLREAVPSRMLSSPAAETIRPAVFTPLRQAAFSTFPSVEVKPDVPAWTKAAPLIGSQTLRPAVVSTAVPGTHEPAIPVPSSLPVNSAPPAVVRQTTSASLPTGSLFSHSQPPLMPSPAMGIPYARTTASTTGSSPSLVSLPAMGLPRTRAIGLTAPPQVISRAQGMMTHFPALHQLITVPAAAPMTLAQPAAFHMSVAQPSLVSPSMMPLRLPGTAIVSPAFTPTRHMPTSPPVGIINMPSTEFAPFGIAPAPADLALGKAPADPALGKQPTRHTHLRLPHHQTAGIHFPHMRPGEIDDTAPPAIEMSLPVPVRRQQHGEPMRTATTLVSRAPQMLYTPAQPAARTASTVAIQRSPVGSSSSVGTESTKAQEQPVKQTAKQHEDQGAAEVNLLASEVWSILKRRMAAEADRRGRW